MSVRSVIRQEAWTLMPESSDTGEDFADPQGRALEHRGRNPSHRTFREIITRPWHAWRHA
ncbi:hypothetical protein QQM39_35735 [Streptomyces sp. DT2A-34]|uniref:DUF7848 domain-containing protein n=1 Tax=Streptomyces sp. DT2A-34 TaxID=3051182 RepID=UPI00265B72C4|nr:hypothetical protein [Streptomyces sp. DT2A-34]MDO0915990.1 hypothetical protein [Streptomyces sp. DT2A-34]